MWRLKETLEKRLSWKARVCASVWSLSYDFNHTAECAQARRAQCHRPASLKWVGAGGEWLREAFITVLATSHFLSVSLLKDLKLSCSDLERPDLDLLLRKVRKMMMKGVLVLHCMILMCGAQKLKEETSHWDLKKHSNGKTCSNLTQVLDNWKFAILTQVKDLLINDHASVLPEYTRIRPLSDALGDLYRQFNGLKDELGRLSAKFDSVEAFVDDLKDGRFPVPQRPVLQLPPSVGLRAPLRAQMRATDRRIITRPMVRARRKGAQKS